ncbi:hypothetical protein ACFYR1_34330 [Streptomyces canus]|uniref:hypothetical protein n=1 Tax=Streptomyces canus TaxID=58343 RepID=UPI003699794A
MTDARGLLLAVLVRATAATARTPVEHAATLSSGATIHLAMTGLMARRLTGEATISRREPTSLGRIPIPG